MSYYFTLSQLLAIAVVAGGGGGVADVMLHVVAVMLCFFHFSIVQHGKIIYTWMAA